MSDPRIDLNIEVLNNPEPKTPPVEPRDWYPSSQGQELVRKFHAAFEEPIGHQPQTIGEVRGMLRVELIENALVDLVKSINDDDLVAQYDTLIEILFQTYGTLVEMGVDAGPGKREVMRSRMSMLKDEFEKPDLFSVLTRQGWRPSYEDYLKHNNLKDPREVLEALAGKPNFYEEVIKFVPDENPEAEALIQTKKGVHYQGVTYFADEPHEYKRRLYNNFCVCGKINVDAIHHVANPDAIDWDIDNNMPRRKDNFHDRVMSGWEPTHEEQLAYENHRLELKKKYPPTKLVNGELEYIVYRNGEQDVDWDFMTNAPRVVEKSP